MSQVTAHPDSLTDTYARTQVYKRQGRRQPALAFADMLAAQPRRLKLHWMSLHGHADWLRSADAVTMVPAEEVEDLEG
jgi:hypothetical protein